MADHTDAVRDGGRRRWVLERFGTEGYVVHRVGHPAEVTILPATFLDAEEWGENALGADIAIKRIAERVADALNTGATI